MKRTEEEIDSILKVTNILNFLAGEVFLAESITIFVQLITKVHLHRQINALDEKEQAAFQKRPLLEAFTYGISRSMQALSLQFSIN